jgi:DNA-binding PadR family transcriptional regulator
MKATTIPLLGYALMGLVHHKPSSGYDLRKVFAETAMGNYSSSPGAIYPGLERLEAGGFIRGTVEETGGMRRRRLYSLTPRGRNELKKWLARPVERNDVLRDAGDAMLRFSFMDQVLGPKACVEFLQDFRKLIAAYLGELEAFLRKNGADMPLSARLAVECGIGGYRNLYEWTARALSEYQNAQATRRNSKHKTPAGGVR